MSTGLTTLETGTKNFSAAATGMQSLLTGFQTLTSNNDALTTGAQALINNSAALTSGSKQVADGAKALETGGKKLGTGATKLADGISQVNTGSMKLKKGSSSLLAGTTTLNTGLGSLDTGVSQLVTGTSTLVGNNTKLLNGAGQLSDGAGKIQKGAAKLADGSGELGNGLNDLFDGSEKLKKALSDGAQEVRDAKASDDSIDMFASPVEDTETKITSMPNNGHAMSAYMMSVALWVGCLALCLMYPLTSYKGKLKNGLAWWASKATVLFVVAVGMAVAMIGMLHVCNGFHPESYGLTVLVAVAAAVAFMSIMYFFDVLLGKVGSFLMLVFMVVQLAGSAGTYPIELSGDFVAKIHDYLPFSYTVNAFRETISGGKDITQTLLVLGGITIVFVLMTIVMFEVKAKRVKNNKPLYLDRFWEEHGLL